MGVEQQYRVFKKCGFPPNLHARNRSQRTVTPPVGLPFIERLIAARLQNSNSKQFIRQLRLGRDSRFGRENARDCLLLPSQL